MRMSKLAECEQRRLLKWINFRLPHQFIYIGLGLVVATFFAMLIRKFGYSEDTEVLKYALQKALLFGLLLISVSKDKIEDEMTLGLRAQSYALAFVIGVVYAIVMPYIEFGVSNVVHNGGEAYKDLGVFQVLLFMLLIQVCFYHVLKRYR
jgi:hypothetical protein